MVVLKKRPGELLHSFLSLLLLSAFQRLVQSPQSLITINRLENELSGVGFEPTPPSGDQKAPRSHSNNGKVCNLESGALDRSAILTVRTFKLSD